VVKVTFSGRAGESGSGPWSLRYSDGEAWTKAGEVVFTSDQLDLRGTPALRTATFPLPAGSLRNGGPRSTDLAIYYEQGNHAAFLAVRVIGH
jgi:hypothetical protein